jgi:signal peptide peptidase SppA
MIRELYNKPLLLSSSFAYEMAELYSNTTLTEEQILKAKQYQEEDGNMLSTGPGQDPVTIENGVAFVSIKGVMSKNGNLMDAMLMGGSVSTSAIKDIAMKLKDDDEVEHVVLDIDSPGGEVNGVQAAANAIRELSKEKKVTSIANDNMLSAAYWIGSAANEIVGTTDSQIGSIGVITVLRDSSEHFAKEGHKFDVIRSGEFKALNTPMEQNYEALVEDTKNKVAAYHARFVDAVATGRNITTEQSQKLSNGKVHMIDNAIENGLADKLGSLDDLKAELMEDTPEATAETASQIIVALNGKMEKLQGTVDTLKDALTETREETKKTRAETLVDKYIDEGKVAPAKRERAIANAMKTGVDEYKDIMDSVPAKKSDGFAVKPENENTDEVTAQEDEGERVELFGNVKMKAKDVEEVSNMHPEFKKVFDRRRNS